MKGTVVGYGHRCAEKFTHTHYNKDMDNKNKVMSSMLIDWLQSDLDADLRYDDGDDSEDWDEVDLEGDEVYESIKEEYESQYSSPEEALEAFTKWLQR